MELFTESVTLKLGEAEVTLKYVPKAEAVPKPELPAAPATPEKPTSNEPAAPTNLLPAGSFWRGERSYTAGRFKGKTLVYFLRVETRNGKRFTGTAYHDGPRSNPSQVSGTLDGTTLVYHQIKGPGGKNYTVKGEIDGDTIRYKLDGDIWGDARGKLTRGGPRAELPLPVPREYAFGDAIIREGPNVIDGSGSWTTEGKTLIQAGFRVKAGTATRRWYLVMSRWRNTRSPARFATPKGQASASCFTIRGMGTTRHSTSGAMEIPAAN